MTTTEERPRPIARDMPYDYAASSAFGIREKVSPDGFVFIGHGDHARLCPIVRVDFQQGSVEDGPCYVGLVADTEEWAFGFKFHRVSIEDGRMLYREPLAAFRERMFDRRNSTKYKVACGFDGCDQKLKYVEPALQVWGCVDHFPNPDGEEQPEAYDLEEHVVVVGPGRPATPKEA